MGAGGCRCLERGKDQLQWKRMEERESGSVLLALFSFIYLSCHWFIGLLIYLSVY
jgi:hypothetical protein